MVLFTRMLYDPLFPQTEASCVAGRDEGHTFSSPSWWSEHSEQTLRTVAVPQQDCCLLRARTRRDIHKRHRTELLRCSGPAWQTGEVRADPTLWVIPHNSWKSATQRSPSPTLPLQPPSQPDTSARRAAHALIAEESHLLQRSQTSSPQHPKGDGLHAAPSWAAPAPASAMYSHGAPAPPAPLLLGLSCPFPRPDQGTWENPMIQTTLTGPDPLCPAETILSTALRWPFARSHKHFQSPEDNRGSGLSRVVSPSNIALYLTTHTHASAPLSDLNPSDSFHQADKMKVFFFLNISFNKICMEYAHLCQWSGKCALSSREHAHCRFPLSFRNYFWSWWFYFVSPADTNQMTEMIWGWILSRRERRRKSERKLW